MITTNSPDLILIHPPYHRRNNSGIIFPLGLGYLASSAELAGFNVKIIDCAAISHSLDDLTLSSLKQWLENELLKDPPRLAFGIGPCTTSAVKGIKAVSEVINGTLPKIPIIYGGPLASIPGQQQLFFDHFFATAVVAGDGELIICDILNALMKKKSLDGIMGLSTHKKTVSSTNIIENLDELPFPLREKNINYGQYRLSTRRDLFQQSFATMSVSRGCPYNCSFCVSGSLRNNSYHRRSNENIINEISWLRNSRKFDSIIFYDDCFFASPNTLETDVINFCSALKKAKINDLKWQIEMRPNILLALDNRLTQTLFQAGCQQINIGFESSSSKTNSLANKNYDNVLVQRKCEQIHSIAQNLKLTGTFILGWPDEDSVSIQNTIEFSKSIPIVFAHFYPLEIYPGTKLFKQLFSHENPLFWYDMVMNDTYHWGEIVYEGAYLKKEDLLSQVSSAYESFYHRPEWQSFAKSVLGENNYNLIKSQVSVWSYDRFNLKK